MVDEESEQHASDDAADEDPTDADEVAATQSSVVVFIGHPRRSLSGGGFGPEVTTWKPPGHSSRRRPQWRGSSLVSMMSLPGTRGMTKVTSSAATAPTAITIHGNAPEYRLSATVPKAMSPAQVHMIRTARR